jgi:hypothetical protein
MSAGNIDDLLDIWAESMENGDEPPFLSHEDLYGTIDATRHGDAPWRCLAVSCSGEVNVNSPTWLARLSNGSRSMDPTQTRKLASGELDLTWWVVVA